MNIEKIIKNKTTFLTIIIVMLFAFMPIIPETSTGVEVNATTVNESNATYWIEQLKTLNKKYYTLDGKKHCYNKSDHGCKYEKTGNILDKNKDNPIVKLCKANKGGVPKASYTPSGGSNYTCVGFMNFALWYIGSKNYSSHVKWTSKKVNGRLKSLIKKGKVVIGDGVYVDGYHCIVITKTNKSKGTFTAIDCNTRPSSNKYNSMIRISGSSTFTDVVDKNPTVSRVYHVKAAAKPATVYNHTFYFTDSDGTTKLASDATVKDGSAVYLPSVSKSGYKLNGWYVKRLKDGTWYNIDSNSWSTSTSGRKLYTAGTSYTIDSSWTKAPGGSSTKCLDSNYRFYAQWTKNQPQPPAKKWVETGTSYSKWLVQKPSASTTTSGTTKKVVTVQAVNAYTSYAYFTNNKQKCWKATNNGYYPNLLKIYSSKSVKSSGYKKDTDGSYFLPRTVSISSPGKLGTVYRLSYKGDYASSFTAGSNLGYTFVWPTSSNTQTIYRTKTVTYVYK